MSRIIVKNLPKHITEDRLRTHFAGRGDITDLQLKYTKDGKFRQFAFIGFKDESHARNAIEYFNGTFIDTNRLRVELCADYGADDKPKSWSKYSKDSDAFKKINMVNDETREESQTKEPKKKKVNPFDELKGDPDFEEFLKVQRNVDSGKGKHIWSDDIVLNNNDNLLMDDVNDDNSNDHDDDKKDNDNDGDDEKSVAINKKGRKKCKKSKNKVSKPKVTPKCDYEFTVKLKGLPYKAKKSVIKQFLSPIKPISLRIPPKIKGIAYVSLKTLKDMKQVFNKHLGFMEGHRIEIKKYDMKISNVKSETKDAKWKNVTPADESVGESGRIFIRNLPYSCVEDDLQKLFSTYGPISELLLPIDSYTKKIKGFAFVTFMFPEHAVKAFAELDGTTFHGRLLHLIPAKSKPEISEPPSFANDDGSSFKKKKETEMKSQANSVHNWNTLFLGSNTLADMMTEKFNIKKSDLLTESTAKDTVAVRMALGETQVVNDMRKFLRKNGVELDSFSNAATQRSKTVILVKNLPVNVNCDEISGLFSKYGLVTRIVLPPNGVTAIVEMQEPIEARAAFRKLAYSNYKHYPLYLEWAPHNVFRDNTEDDDDDENDKNDNDEAMVKEGSDAMDVDVQNDEAFDNDSEPEDDTTIFVKNLNFDTNESDFLNHFTKCGNVYNATIAKKKSAKGLLSMGYGFVQYKKQKSTQKALKELQHSLLDGHTLELKLSNRSSVPQMTKRERKPSKLTKQLSSKILVRNIPFEAKRTEVEQLFSVFGNLKTVRLPKKFAGTGTHRGFAFVDFVTKNDAKRAFNALCHSTHLYGRRLVLEWASDAGDESVANGDGNDTVTRTRQ